MLNKFFIICISLICALAAQAGFYQPPPPEHRYIPPIDNTVIDRDLSYFTTLIIYGQVEVSLKTGKNRYHLTARGTPEALAALHYEEKNDTLIIYGNNNWRSKPTPLNMEITTKFLNELQLHDYYGGFQALNLNTPFLNADLDNYGQVILHGKIGLHNLIVSGEGNTQIHGIDSQSMQIIMRGSPVVDLSGVANLESLVAKGNGRLRLSWTDSNRLYVRLADSVYIALAGVVNFIDMQIKGSSHFSGQYLRMKDGYIKTMDDSIADIQFLKAQSILSKDTSHVYFYGKAPYKANFMAKEGAILDMNDH